MFCALGFSTLILVLIRLLSRGRRSKTARLGVILSVLVENARSLGNYLVRQVVGTFSRARQRPNVASFRLTLRSRLFNRLTRNFLLNMVLRLRRNTLLRWYLG